MKKWDYTLLNIAKLISKHSTCIRKKVGCLIAVNNRIISVGYNGTVSGKMHCQDVFKDKEQGEGFYDAHGDFSRHNEVHAEQNCISYSAKHGLSIDGGCLYVTVSPCIDCAKIIVASGIKRVVYAEKYDRDPKGLDFLEQSNIECELLEVL